MTLDIKIFADGASIDDMRTWARNPLVKGFTTNPTLMRRAGVREYARFAKEAIAAIPNRPISFEVLSDDCAEMACEAREIATWGPNAVVKIPISNTRGEPTTELIHQLSADGIRVNVTAVLTLAQVDAAVAALRGGAASNVSIFAGRIADTGRDPAPIVARALEIAADVRSIEVIWASPREVWNVYQANELGCPIITLTTDLLAKLALRGKDLEELSLETVRMFHTDAVQAGLTLKTRVQLT